MGSANAAVFPVPVWAMPTTSRAARTCGMVWVWIGVGVAYCWSARARVRVSASPSSRKEVKVESFMWRDGPSPIGGEPRVARSIWTPRVVWVVNDWMLNETGRKPRRGIRARDPRTAPIGYGIDDRPLISTNGHIATQCGNYKAPGGPCCGPCREGGRDPPTRRTLCRHARESGHPVIREGRSRPRRAVTQVQRLLDRPRSRTMTTERMLSSLNHRWQVPHVGLDARSRFHCSGVSPPVAFLASSISVAATRISARVLRSGASSSACFSAVP
jgi:hypothetical protein